MKRALLLILVLLMPLQLSWAAVASYCQNEASPTRVHFGHHEHKASQKTLSIKLSTVDHVTESGVDTEAECGFCHLSCCQSVTAYLQLTLPAGFNLAGYPFIPSDFSSHIAEGPEKPNWQLAA